MTNFPKDPKKIRERIRRYERGFREEQARFGAIRDGAGKRYSLGPLYLLMGDVPGALEAFRWFEEQFPDDSGEPGNHLCWTIALYLSGDEAAASKKLLQTMLLNLYLIPNLLGDFPQEIDMWHGCSDSEIQYLEYIPHAFLALWDLPARDWARLQYQSDDFRRIRNRYIEIFRELVNMPRGPQER